MLATTQPPTSHAPVRRYLAAFAATLAIGCGAASAARAETVTAPPITVDGATVNVPALERNKKVFVPVRGVFEKLGASVTYTAPSSIVARKSGEDLARLTVGSRSATVLGASRELAAAPFASQGHVMVPLRLISEAAGAVVTYVPSPRAVRITHGTVAAAPVAAVADPAASAAPVAEEHHGIPWWVWLLAALVILGLILSLLRRKKEPIIVTSSTPRGSDPVIKTRR